ncbi:branched-chain amino acid ABC transporter permease [Marinobacter sp. F4218]|uniref:branched-chain amino acid ABC transporter permease n=1 Tax=Marinobacter sp. F4218 TaxID=2862868 RepID=UPI001C627096|nr:branched-chain amino acid ABC transporter permease [Marinobacter sp. F4218]MBW7472089.1 branched-chain amino acid ABC transporter permease [Marinobacter sp. F4218]
MIFEKRTERIFLAIFFVVALCIPLFLEDNSFFVGKATTVLILAVFVMSLDFLVGRVGLVTLGHALFYGLGGYLFVILTPEYEAVNFWTYAIYIMAISALIALIVGVVVLRTSGIYFIMITLAISQMAYYFFFDSLEFGGNDGLFIFMKPETSIFGLSFLNLDNPSHFYYLALLAVLVTLLAIKIILRSRFGRIVEASRLNPERTEALGYNIFAFRLISYVIGSTLAAYAGLLFALQYGYVNPQFMTWEMSGTALVMSILGGLGTIYGAILGTLTYEGLQYVFEHMSEDWMLLMGGAIILMVLLLRKGLAGYLEKLLEK